ncbi:MAG: hypothetical protein LBL25_02060, partial [Oscillospiraceae bacterium]|nr:hypothetical protein [Oscillospiraceae bacterium]
MKKHLQIHGFLRRALSLALAAALTLGLAPAFTPGSQPPGILSAPAALAAGAAVPRIQLQPADSTYALGAQARFYVRAMSPDGGYLSYQWYMSYKEDDGGTEIPGATSSVLATDAPNAPGTYYYWAEITNTLSEGATATVTSAKAITKVVNRTLPTHVINGDMEYWRYDGDHAGIYVGQQFWSHYSSDAWGGLAIDANYSAETKLNGWSTTHDVKNEHSNRYNSYPTPSVGTFQVNKVNGTTANGYKVSAGVNGEFIMELGNGVRSSIYQDVATVPGKIYEWSLWYGNYGTQSNVMSVVIGPAINSSDDYTGTEGSKWENEYYPYGMNPFPAQSTKYNYFEAITNALMNRLGYNRNNMPAGEYSQEYNGKMYYVSVVGLSGSSTSKTFSGSYTVPEGQGTTVFGFAAILPDGNSGSGLDNIIFASGSPVSANQEISYTGETELAVNTQTGFAYALVEIRGSSVTALQENIEARYDMDGAGGSPNTPISPNGALGDWYYDSSINGAGVLTFYGLTPGKTYRVIGIPVAAISATLHTNESPADVLDEGYYSDVKILPAKNNDEGGVVASVTAGIGTDNKAFITVENSLSRVEYALLPALSDDPSKPDTVNPAKIWIDGGGELRFEGLDPNTVYFLVVRPLGYNEIDYAAAAQEGALKIKTPEAGQDIKANDVTRASDGKAISIADTKAGYTYALVDPDTGEIFDSKNSASGETVTFPATAGMTYRVAAKPPQGSYMKGVRVYPYPGELEIDYANDRVTSGGSYIPATVEYEVNNEGIKFGTGSGYIDLSDKLLAAGTVTYRLSAGDFADAKVQPALTLTFDARPAAPAASDYTVDYTNEKITAGLAELEYRTGASGAWETLEAGVDAEFSAIGWTGASGGNIDLRFPASQVQDNEKFASFIKNESIASRPAAPTGLTAALVTPGNSASGLKIDKLEDSTHYIYRQSGTTGDWSESKTGSAIEEDTLPYGENYNGYDFRFPATASAPASRSVTVKPEPISITAEDFAPLTYGYESATPAKVTIKNIDTEKAYTVDIELDAPGKNYFELAENSGVSVAAGPSVSTVTVTPKTRLNAGQYNATITATYDSGKTFATEITLEVGKKTWDAPTPESEPVSDVTESSFAITLAPAPDGADLKWQFDDQEVAPTTHEGNKYTFTELSARKTYNVKVKAVSDDENHNDSPLVSLKSAHTAMPAPTASEIVKINYAAETLGFADGIDHGDAIVPGNYTVTVKANDKTETVVNGGSVAGYADGGFTVSVMRDGVGEYPASAETTFQVAGRSEAQPTAFHITPATTDISNDGVITCADNFQYRIHTEGGGGAQWIDAGKRVTVGAGKYDVRKSAAAAAFASMPSSVEITFRNNTVAIESITANGEAGKVNTTALTVEFSMPVEGFTAHAVEFTGDTKDIFHITGVSQNSAGAGKYWDIGVAPNAAAASDDTATPALTVNIYGWENAGGLGYAFAGGSATTNVTVNRAIPEATPAAAIDYEKEQLTGLDTASYTIDGVPRTTDSNGTLAIEESWMTGAKHSIIKIAVGAHINSASQELPIPERPPVPSGTPQDAKDESGKGSFPLTDSGAAYEYQSFGDPADDWDPVSGNIITNLAPGVYSVRVKAVPGASFASAAKAFRIHTFGEVDFDSVYVGYAVGTEVNAKTTPETVSPQKITGDPVLEIESVAVTEGNDKFSVSQTDDWIITPNSGLTAGSHTGTITITYKNDGGSATQNVKFTVHPKAEIESVTAGSSKDNDDYKGITDTLTIEFARPIVLTYPDVTVSGAAIKDGSEFVSTSDNTVYTLKIKPASMANKTGDPITVSVHLGSDYYYQISNIGTNTLQNSDATITIPRAIETAKAVTLIDNYSTSFIQFTLKRETDGYYPIE